MPQPKESSGNVDEFTDGPVSVYTPQLICISPTSGYVYLYPLADGTCSKHSSSYVNSISSLTGGACANVAKAIMNLQPRCPVSAKCGIDTGTPVGDSSANHLPVSLALLVSLLGFLFYQY